MDNLFDIVALDQAAVAVVETQGALTPAPLNVS
jgi:hypothetical protein